MTDGDITVLNTVTEYRNIDVATVAFAHTMRRLSWSAGGMRNENDVERRCMNVHELRQKCGVFLWRGFQVDEAKVRGIFVAGEGFHVDETKCGVFLWRERGSTWMR